jgi:hypothetical protein
VLGSLWQQEVLGPAGALIEVGALAWLWLQARSELLRRGEGRSLRSVVDEWRRYVFEGPPTTVTRELRLRSGGASAGGIEITVRVDETDVERLEREIGELRTRHWELEKAVETRIEKTNARWSTHYNELAKRIAEFEVAERKLRRDAWRRARLGFIVFGAGAILSGLANLAPS